MCTSLVLGSGDRKSRSKLDKYILKRLKLIIIQAVENVEYYKELFEKNNIDPNDINTLEDLKIIPPTSKKDIKESQLDYVSNKFKKEELKTSRTSGSTGEPFVSYFDKRAWQILKLKSKLRARMACGFKPWEKFVIVEAMTPNEAEEHNHKAKLKKLLIRRKFISVYEPVENHIGFYEKFKPTTIYGFPSYFQRLSEHITKNNINMDYVKRLYSSSEVFDPNSRKIIEKAFKTKVYDIYGSTETKEVAWECPKHEGYHINEDLVIVEIVDDDNNPVKDGDVGKILITTLQNLAMPLIRYDVGDSGKMISHKCSCGRTFKLMKPVYGRQTDYFELEGGRKLSPYELTMSVEGIEGILKQQHVRINKNKIKIILKVDGNFKKESINKIKENCNAILGANIDVEIDLSGEFILSKNAKFRVAIPNI